MPVIPNIPGVEQFAGDYFHNLHWDTGVQLAGKRVAVVGNGSSGVQLIVSGGVGWWWFQVLTIGAAWCRRAPRCDSHALHPLRWLLHSQA